MEISASAIKSYDECQYRFKLRYIDKVQPVDPIHIATSLGKAVHKVIHYFYQSRIFQQDLLTNLWSDILNEQLRADKLRVDNDAFGKLAQDGLDLLNIFYNRQVQETLCIPAMSEYPFLLNLQDDIWIRGIFDLIIDGLIEDFKTGKYPLSPSELEKDIQITIYAWAYEKIFGVPPTRIALFFLRSNQKLYASRTVADFQNMVSKILSIANTKDFPPSTKNCFWCAYRSVCQYNTKPKELRLT